MLDDIRFGSDSRQNWRTINAAMAAQRSTDRELNRLRQVVAAQRDSREITIERRPFRVYNIPNSLRPGLGLPTTPDWWRLFTVQHGYVNNVKTAACDDADGEGTDAMEIPVLSGVPKYYIWVDSTLSGSNVTANTIQTGTAAWPGFPNQTQTNKFSTLLARVDTLTNLATKQAIIRQFTFEDIILPGAGGGGGIKFRGDYDPTKTYTVNDMVIIRGSIVAGTYLCVVTPPVGLPGTDPSWGVYWVTISGGLGWL